MLQSPTRVLSIRNPRDPSKMMAAALPVDEETVDVQAILQRMQQGLPPADVQEYLWRVRIEAEGIPNVVVSDVDPRQYDTKQTANMPAMPDLRHVSNNALLPTDEWKENLLADFAELRQLIARWQELGPPENEPSLEDNAVLKRALRTAVPRMNDEDGWRTFFFGKAPVSPNTPASPGAGDDEMNGSFGTPPHLRLLLQFDQVLTRRLLTYHTEWLETTEAVSRARAAWIYALLARLDKPVHAEVAAMIRQLLRRCWQLRNDLQDTTDTLLKPLNILISITGDFFGQLEEMPQ